MATKKIPAAQAADTTADRRRAHKAKLTDERVLKHSNPTGKTPFLWDDGKGSVAGFGVRATEGGGRQFTLRYRYAGRQRSLSLGAVEKHENVDAARVKARERLDLLAKGIDPAMGGNGTMQGVWDCYIKSLRTGIGRIRDPGTPASDKTITDAQSAWNTHFKNTIGDLPPKKLTAARVQDMHRAMSVQRVVVIKGRGGNNRRGGKFAANRAMDYLQSAWRTSAVGGGLTKGVDNPFGEMQMNTEKPRKEYLKSSQAPTFFEAVAKEPLHYQAYWHLKITLGPRDKEMRSLRWADVHIKRDDQGSPVGGVLTFRDTKNHSDHELALPAKIAHWLDALPRDGAKVFGFSYPKASWERIRKRTGLTSLRQHDIRRTVGTWQGAAGTTSNQIGALLNHKSDVTSKVYIALAGNAEVKQTVAESQAELVAQYGGNVVPFPAPEKAKARRRA